MTLGELGRRIEAMHKDMRDMRGELVGRREYDSDQVGIDRRFKEVEADVSDQGRRLDGVVSDIAKDKADVATWQRSNRAQWVLALVLAVAGPIITIIVTRLAGGAS